MEEFCRWQNVIRTDFYLYGAIGPPKRLAGLHPQTSEMADTIGPFYKGHEYRYLPEGVTMPTLNYPLVFAVLDVLDAQVLD
jgi:hypothetical protein